MPKTNWGMEISNACYCLLFMNSSYHRLILQQSLYRMKNWMPVVTVILISKTTAIYNHVYLPISEIFNSGSSTSNHLMLHMIMCLSKDNNKTGLNKNWWRWCHFICGVPVNWIVKITQSLLTFIHFDIPTECLMNYCPSSV